MSQPAQQQPPPSLPSPAGSNVATLSHISLPIRSLPLSRKFYTAALSPLGLFLVYDSSTNTAPATTVGISSSSNQSKTPPRRVLGYGPDPDHEILNLFEHPDPGAQSATGNDSDSSSSSAAAAPSAKPGPGFHVAFTAPSRQAVREFHARAIENGGRDKGRPGLREAYGRDYFAAFVEDVDGWKLEVVCKVPAEVAETDEI